MPESRGGRAGEQIADMPPVPAMGALPVVPARGRIEGEWTGESGRRDPIARRRHDGIVNWRGSD